MLRIVLATKIDGSLFSRVELDMGEKVGHVEKIAAFVGRNPPQIREKEPL